MSAGRVILVLALLAAGLAASGLLLSRSMHALRDSPYHDALLGTRTTSTTPHRRKPRHRAATRAKTRSHRSDPSRDDADADTFLGLRGASALRIAALEVAGGLLLVAALGLALTVRRTRMRGRRHYALYELHLSAHDEAKPQDLEDMVEAIANIVRAWPGRRARDGQPFVAVELVSGEGESGMEWSINVRCQPEAARALDAAISAAYPDVRLGRRHAEAPTPRDGELAVPGHVLRFRKERSFVYSLIAAQDALASPPLEQIARAQIELGEPSVVRFALTPAPSYFEEIARRRYRRHENKLVRQERWGLPEGGLSSTLNRAEMTNAQRTQNRSLFWLEVQVAGDSADACKTIAAAVQSRRGENRLHRRWMTIRNRLYRRRFPRALGPLIPSLRCLVSAGEVAHLLALPSARMKGVPVRRMSLPRIPVPPEAMRAREDHSPPAPAPAPDMACAA